MGYLQHLSDAAFRETSALASGFGMMSRYVPFPVGSRLSHSEAMTQAGLAYHMPASSSIADDTIRMEQEGQCKPDRINKEACQLTGGEYVPHTWTGSDTGANSCNTCNCLDGVLACTKMLATRRRTTRAIARRTQSPPRQSPRRNTSRTLPVGRSSRPRIAPSRSTRAQHQVPLPCTTRSTTAA